jgi:hypothetical protein
MAEQPNPNVSLQDVGREDQLETAMRSAAVPGDTDQSSVVSTAQVVSLTILYFLYKK